VAPTILTLMGIAPTNMDGIVLADALPRPAPELQAAADRLAPVLAGYQKGLIAQAAADAAT
jgi:hypothetical protein